MRASFMLAVLAAFGLGAQPASAQLAISTADLAALCDEAGDAGNVCTGYLLGLADLQKAFRLMNEGSPFFCAPNAYSGAVLASALKDWLAANPDGAGMPAMHGALAALQGAFPCGG